MHVSYLPRLTRKANLPPGKAHLMFFVMCHVADTMYCIVWYICTSNAMVYMCPRDASINADNND